MVSIETSIFKALLFNQEYVRRVMPYLEPEFFDGHYRTLFKTYKRLFDEYNKVPSLEALGITLQDSPIGESEFEDVVELIEDCYKNREDLADTDWLVDQTETYVRDKAIYDAIYKSINIIEGTDKNLDKHAIPDMLDTALGISFDSSIGMEYFDDAEKRYDYYTSEDQRIKLPLDCLNFMSNGGLKLKSLSAILSGPNVGKSSLMCFLAGELMKSGYNVLYISMEMGEEVVQERIDANMLNTSTDGIKNLSKPDFMSKIDNVKSKTKGRLFVKEYPTGAAHAGHFRHLIKELKQKKKFEPHVVFIDYMNICASSRYKSMSGVNSYSYVKAIAEELRGLAVENNLPIMTATQVNRDSHNSQAPDMTSVSESFGVAATLDWFIAATTDEVLEENGQQLFHLLKTRWGNKTNVKPQLVNVDFNKMRYTDVGSTQEVQNSVGQRKLEKKEKKSLEDIDWD